MIGQGEAWEGWSLTMSSMPRKRLNRFASKHAPVASRPPRMELGLGTWGLPTRPPTLMKRSKRFSDA